MTENNELQPTGESTDAVPVPAAPSVPTPEATGAVASVPAVEPASAAAAAPSSGGVSGTRIALIAGGAAVAILLAIGIFASGVAVGGRMGGRIDVDRRGVPPMMSQGDLPRDHQRGPQGFEGRDGRGDRGPRDFDDHRSLPDTSSAQPRQ